MFRVLLQSIFVMIEVDNLLGNIKDAMTAMIIVIGLMARSFSFL